MARQFRWILAALFVCSVSSAHAAPLADETLVIPACDEQKGPEQKGPETKAQPPGERRPGDRSEHSRIKWWEDPKWRAEVGISDRQSTKIKEIFDVEMVKLRAMREELTKVEANIEQTMSYDRAHLAVLTEQWDRVGNLLSEMYKTRQLMLYRINRALTPEQRAKLQAMSDRMDKERRQKEPERHR